GFALEALDEIGDPGKGLVQEFYGDGLANPHPLGLVNHPHAAGREALGKAIAALNQNPKLGVCRLVRHFRAHSLARGLRAWPLPPPTVAASVPAQQARFRWSFPKRPKPPHTRAKPFASDGARGRSNAHSCFLAKAPRSEL